MTDKDRPKPVTLADYIPPAPTPEPKSKRRRRPTQAERQRLDDLERSIDQHDDDDPKPKQAKGFWSAIIMIAIILLVLRVFD